MGSLVEQHGTAHLVIHRLLVPASVAAFNRHLFIWIILMIRHDYGLALGPSGSLVDHVHVGVFDLALVLAGGACGSELTRTVQVVP